MAFGVLIHRPDSKYEDNPAEKYQFPKSYLSRAKNFVGNWILYYEPTKIKDTRGYYAAAKIERISPDPNHSDMFIAYIQEGSYFDFSNQVSFKDETGLVEKGLYNDQGAISGRAQWAVRPISTEDFNRILDLGIDVKSDTLPRFDENQRADFLEEAQAPFDISVERRRMALSGNRLVRDRVFRKTVLTAYDSRCAFTGLKLINGGGRAEVQAAHIKPVASNGPDTVKNGVALSGTAHWMFDRGLIGLSDNLEILISRHVNDRDSIEGLINKSGFARVPSDERQMPHPSFIKWHRENCFKQ